MVAHQSTAAVTVFVRKWGEGSYEKNLSALRVLVGGQHAGSVFFEDGTWHASTVCRYLTVDLRDGVD